MKAKIIGIGKCGSRLTYDFFAYVSDTPTAYEIRRQGRSQTFTNLMNTFSTIKEISRAWEESKLRVRRSVQQIFGHLLIYEPPILVTIDSDTKNNEIIDWIQFINKDGKVFIFPGESYEFAEHEGGCNYHIISENICNEWDDIDERIISNEGAEIVVTAFSIGGGTGGGAAPLISSRCRQFALENSNNETRQLHFMGMGVLPLSDESYRQEYVAGMSTSEKYNTGRFFVNMYGQRSSEHLDFGMDSVWLFSNDLLRIFTETTYEDELKDPNLSLINRYVSASLTVICNASSSFTKSEKNFDPIEMNNALNGYPFISGHGVLAPERFGDRNLNANTVRNLLKLALNNITTSDSSDELYGLSVPVKQSRLEEVNRILDQVEEGLTRKGKLESILKSYDIKKAPVEFRTASTVVSIYGQPQDTHSPFKDGLIHDLVSTLFSNSKFEDFYYRHPGDNDILLILMVDPFISFVQKSIYYYTEVSWIEHRARHGLDELFDDLIDPEDEDEKTFDREKIEQILIEEERISDDVLGQATVELLSKFEQPLKVKKEQVIDAFSHLNKTYNQEKIPERRRTRLG